MWTVPNARIQYNNAQLGRARNDMRAAAMAPPLLVVLNPRALLGVTRRVRATMRVHTMYFDCMMSSANVLRLR